MKERNQKILGILAFAYIFILVGSAINLQLLKEFGEDVEPFYFYINILGWITVLIVTTIIITYKFKTKPYNQEVVK